MGSWLRVGVKAYSFLKLKDMDLLHKIEGLLRLKYNVSLDKNTNNSFILSISKLNNKYEHIKEQIYLPFDCLTEERIIKHINLLKEKLDDELNK